MGQIPSERKAFWSFEIEIWDYLENNLPNPPNPPLLKGGEGGFSWFAGDKLVM